MREHAYICPHFLSSHLVFHLSGLLWLLVQLGEAVSVMMNSPDTQIACDENQSIHTSNGQLVCQNQEQQSLDHCRLPLILKQVSVQTSCSHPQDLHSNADRNHNKKFKPWINVPLSGDLGGFYPGQIFALHVWDMNV